MPICVDNDFARWPLQSANSAFPYAALPLALFNPVFRSATVTLLARLKLLVTWRSHCQQRVGVFFSSDRILHEMPQVASCLILAHWSYRFLISPRSYGESTLMLCFGSHQKEQVRHIIAGGKLLVPSCTYSDLLIFITILPALPTSFQNPQHCYKGW